MVPSSGPDAVTSLSRVGSIFSELVTRQVRPGVEHRRCATARSAARAGRHRAGARAREPAARRTDRARLLVTVPAQRRDGGDPRRGLRSRRQDRSRTVGVAERGARSPRWRTRACAAARTASRSTSCARSRRTCCLGVDRDSELVAPVFDERDPAVLSMVGSVIEEAHRAGRKIGICGQAPTDYPEFMRFLVERGIDSISLNPGRPAARHRDRARGRARGRRRHTPAARDGSARRTPPRSRTHGPVKQGNSIIAWSMTTAYRCGSRRHPRIDAVMGRDALDGERIGPLLFEPTYVARSRCA